MNLVLIIVLSGIVIYFLLKIGLYIYRPFFVAKLISDIQSKYDKLQVMLDKDIELAVENLKKWESEDGFFRDHSSESELKERIAEAKASKTHGQKVNEKFIRLRERFIGNPKRLSEAILSYKRYLEVKLKQRQAASIFTNAVTSGVITFEEFLASANETMIILDECEKRLDMLLDS